MSLRARLLAGMAVVAVVFIVASLSINRYTEQTLIRQVDGQLERSDQQVRRGPDIDGDNQNTGGAPSALFVAIYDEGTDQLTVVYEPTIAASSSPPALTSAQITERVDQGPFTADATKGGTRYRVKVRSDSRAGHEVVFALPLEDVDATLDRLLAIQAIAAAAILATLGLVTFWVLRLGVRPVQKMTATAKAIGEGDLSQRIPDTVPGTEAGELGLALNHMLGRIEEAFDERTRSEDRLRQFVADASHELRTPLTAIRGNVELLEMQLKRTGNLDDEVAGSLFDLKRESGRMSRLTDDLLTLARSEAPGGLVIQCRPVDLSAVAKDVVRTVLASGPVPPVSIEGDDEVIVTGDRDRLEQVMLIFCDNARRYTPADGSIVLRISQDRTGARFSVTDTGSGISAEDQQRIFTRFFRADASRERASGGAGLGLAIAKAIVSAHGGDIEVKSALGVGSTFAVILPNGGCVERGNAHS